MSDLHHTCSSTFFDHLEIIACEMHTISKPSYSPSGHLHVFIKYMAWDIGYAQNISIIYFIFMLYNNKSANIISL